MTTARKTTYSKKRTSQARRTLHLTRKIVAQRVGVTEATIYNWETGKTVPDANALRRLSSALQCDVMDLYE